MSYEHEVPTKVQLGELLDALEQDPDSVFGGELTMYSEDINEILVDLADGEDVTPEVRRELAELYDEWEAENFPVAMAQVSDDDEDLNEGGPEGSVSEKDDPDLLPDPADV